MPMRIAFVNQPIDCFLPPIQNSLGACTYGLARQLEEFAEVTAYGMRGDQAHPGVPDELVVEGLRCRFTDAPITDRALERFAPRLSPWMRPFNHGFTPPFSSSRLNFPSYTRKVARTVARGPHDLVHIQHDTQFVPAIKAANPSMPVVLQLQAELFPDRKSVV